MVVEIFREQAGSLQGADERILGGVGVGKRGHGRDP